MALSIRTYVVRGERKSSPALEKPIRQRFEWEVTAPKIGEADEII